jgi:hypothetical protein
LISAFATVHEASGVQQQPSVFLSFWENGGPPSYRDNRTVTVAVKGATPPSQATEYRIDEEHANPLAAWQAMGRPNGPSAAQLKVLVAASEVTPVPLVLSIGTVTVTMSPNSAVVVVFKSDDSDVPGCCNTSAFRENVIIGGTGPTVNAKTALDCCNKCQSTAACGCCECDIIRISQPVT